MNHSIWLAAALATSVGVAHANSGQASIKVSNISLTAFDLVSTDQYQPSFEFIAGAAKTSVSVRFIDQPPLDQQFVNGYLAPLSTSYSDAKNNATALVSSTSLEITSTGTGQNYGLYTIANSGYITGGGPDYLNVRVAPGTGILLSGTADVSTSAICNADPHTTICGVSANLQVLINGSGTNKYITGGSSYQGPVGSVYANFSNSFQDVYVHIGGSVQAYSTSYVPEPSAYALLMAGGLMAAGIAKRRKLGS